MPKSHLAMSPAQTGWWLFDCAPPWLLARSPDEAGLLGVDSI